MEGLEQIGTASYSPEDNKLRLYPYSRLSKELYDRVKESGFIWAPKQELFVAPMWTPQREALLIELCGEIGDEDKSLVERAEERSERFEGYSDSRMTDANQARQSVSAIADNIPLGQPILVGHHSEKHARRDAERIESGMRKAVKMWETAKYWESRAAGAIRAAKYKERPDVRARRIKKIEAEKRKMERNKSENESALRFWHGKFNLINRETGEKKPLEITEENRSRIAHAVGNDSRLGYLPVAKSATGDWHAWDVLRPDEDRYQNCPAMTVAEVQSIALEHYPRLIAYCDQWINHYNNRLIYERAMLTEQGGTATDQIQPEVGGACKCWASRRGGWSFIAKVNKVSVSVWDNWGNGGDNFLRKIEFDKLSSIWSKEQVETARAEGRLIADEAGFFLRDREEAKALPAPKEKTEEEKAFEALRETAEQGVKIVAVNQLFPTPFEIALKVAELADIQTDYTVLEPSAGTGNLVKAIRKVSPGAIITAVEINPNLAEALHDRRGYLRPADKIISGDFLERNGDLGMFDRVVMNPPFERGSDITHIEHAMKFLKPSGKLVAICANGPRQQERLQPLADAWIELPDDSFAGTGVRTAIFVYSK